MQDRKVWVVVRSVLDDKGQVVEVPERHYLEQEPLGGFKEWCSTQEHVEVREYSFSAVVYPKPAPPPPDDLKGSFVVFKLDGEERDGHVDASSDELLTIRLWQKGGPQMDRADQTVIVKRSDPRWRLKYPRRKP